jgi:hypothetical protein
MSENSNRTGEFSPKAILSRFADTAASFAPPPSAQPTQSPPVAPAALSTAAEVEVWGRGDKFARGACPDQASGAVQARLAPVAAEIAVKAHGRKPPQPPTLDVVLEQFRLYEQRPLTIGKFCVQWLRHQPELERDKQLARGEALRRIREGLAKQDQVTLAARLDRFIACYFVAQSLGWEVAWKLRYAAIRELMPLFGRNAATEEYVLRPELAEVTRALWARMLAEHLTADVVRKEVGRIRPPKVFRLHGRSGRLAAIRRDLKRLKVQEDFLEVIRLAQEGLARLGVKAETAIA